MNVLSLNSGSSSLKFGLYGVDADGVDNLLGGESESILGELVALSRQPTGQHSVPVDLASSSAIKQVAKRLRASGLPGPAAIGHRIVHGGPNLRRHCVIDDAVMRQLDADSAFAPLHMPAALALIRLAGEQFPGVPQVACFDTTFHATMPDVARVLPLPQEWQAQGLQRYGFHGLSCESIVQLLGGHLPARLIIAHLGNGASVTAVRDGRSIDTSMGLTPTGGVIMGTRSGDLDPGVLIYLLREHGFDAGTLEALIDRQSGLLGISGVSSDMRKLRAAVEQNPAARLAIEMFCCSVKKQIAAMAAVLEGVDMIVFTGGIGENDAPVRTAICNGLSWIGLTLDAERNRLPTNPLSPAASSCKVLVLPSQEDQQIARHTWSLLS